MAVYACHGAVRTRQCKARQVVRKSGAPGGRGNRVAIRAPARKSSSAMVRVGGGEILIPMAFDADDGGACVLLARRAGMTRATIRRCMPAGERKSCLLMPDADIGHIPILRRVAPRTVRAQFAAMNVAVT